MAIALAAVSFVVGAALGYRLPYPYWRAPYEDLGAAMMVFSVVSFLVGLALMATSEDTGPESISGPNSGPHLLRLSLAVGLAFAIGVSLVAILQRPLPTPGGPFANLSVYLFDLVFPVARFLIPYQRLGEVTYPDPSAQWGVGLGVGGTILVLMILISFVRRWPFHPRNPRREWDRPRCVAVVAVLTLVCGGLVTVAGYLMILRGVLGVVWSVNSAYYTPWLTYGLALLGLGILLSGAGSGLSTFAERAWGLSLVLLLLTMPVAAPVVPLASALSGSTLVGLLLEREHFATRERDFMPPRPYDTTARKH